MKQEKNEEGFASAGLTAGQLNAIVKKLGGKEKAMAFLRGETAVISSLLASISTVNIQLTGKFAASDHFTVNGKEVGIGWIGDNFRNNFLSKVEEAQAKTTLCISRLKENSLDTPIIVELGSRTETTLANVWELLRKQPNGESGKLLTNGDVNIFYVRDAKGVLWAVGVNWSGDSWDVGAYSVADPLGWDGGYRVFSRNS